MIVTVTLNASIDKRYEVKQLKTGQVNRVGSCTLSAGGKGLNVARVAVIAGEEVTATGFTGGHTGLLIEELAQENGIKTDFVRTKGESRACINILNTETGEQTELLEGGTTISGEKIEEMKRKYNHLLSKAAVVTISGSVPHGVTPELYVHMIRQAKKEGVPVLVDTSGKLLEVCLEEKPDLIKPNQDEIKELLGEESTGESEEKNLQKAGMLLMEKGISYVVISMGGAGSLMVTPRGIYRVQIPAVKVENTVGCGDSMLAGFAAGMTKGWHDEKLLRFSSAVSAANAMQRATGFYEKADCEALYEKITVIKLPVY